MSQGSQDEMQKAVRLGPNRSSSYMNLATLHVRQTSAAEGRYKLQEGDFAGTKIADALQWARAAQLMVAETNSHVTVGASKL